MSFELVPALDISSSGLQAERTRMRAAANNLANTRSISEDGEPYQRREVIFEAVGDTTLGNDDGRDSLQGVKVADVQKSDRDPELVHAPYHPQANGNGMVKMPNISPMEEMMNMMTATRAYEANLSAIKRSRQMAEQAINLLKS